MSTICRLLAFETTIRRISSEFHLEYCLSHINHSIYYLCRFIGSNYMLRLADSHYLHPFNGCSTMHSYTNASSHFLSLAFNCTLIIIKLRRKRNTARSATVWTSRVHVDNHFFFPHLIFIASCVLLVRQTIFLCYIYCSLYSMSSMSFTRSVVFTSAPLAAAYWCECCTTSDKHLITFTVYRREAIYREPIQMVISLIWNRTHYGRILFCGCVDASYNRCRCGNEILKAHKLLLLYMLWCGWCWEGIGLGYEVR